MRLLLLYLACRRVLGDVFASELQRIIDAVRSADRARTPRAAAELEDQISVSVHASSFTRSYIHVRPEVRRYTRQQLALGVQHRPKPAFGVRLDANREQPVQVGPLSCFCVARRGLLDAATAVFRQ